MRRFGVVVSEGYELSISVHFSFFPPSGPSLSTPNPILQLQTSPSGPSVLLSVFHAGVVSSVEMGIKNVTVT